LYQSSVFSSCLKPVIGANGHGNVVFEWSTFSLKLKCFYSKVGVYAPEYAVIISTDNNQMNAVKGKFDLIIDTVPYGHNVNPYVSTLNFSGTLVLVGYLGGLEPVLNTVPMILGRKSVAGSLIGGIAETQELLDFCGEHNIVSEIEIIKIEEINEAYERMIKSDVRYRFVIDMASLKK